MSECHQSEHEPHLLQRHSQMSRALHLQIMKTAVIFNWNIYEGHSKETCTNKTFGLHYETLPGFHH